MSGGNGVQPQYELEVANVAVASGHVVGTSKSSEQLHPCKCLSKTLQEVPVFMYPIKLLL